MQQDERRAAPIPAVYVDTWSALSWKGHVRIVLGEWVDRKLKLSCCIFDGIGRCKTFGRISVGNSRRKTKGRTKGRKESRKLSSYEKKTKEAAEEAPPREMDGVVEFESSLSIRDDTEADNVIDLHGSRGKRKREMPTNQPHMVPSMSDAPSRTEIAAQLQAAEARTETRIAQLGLVIETRASASDHKLDLLAADMRSLVGIVSELGTDYSELRTDYKETRKAMLDRWNRGCNHNSRIGSRPLDRRNKRSGQHDSGFSDCPGRAISSPRS